jgi:hypothetical protein
VQLLYGVCLGRLFARNRSPGCREDFFEIFLQPGGRKNNYVWWYVAAALFWSLWLTRNERIFQHKVPFTPFQPIYKAYSLMLLWKPLLGSKKLPAVEASMQKLDEKIKALNSRGRTRA